MRDSQGTATSLADNTKMMQRAAITIPVAAFLILAAVTLAAAPGDIGGRLLLIGIDGVCLAAFSALGLFVARPAR